MAEATPDSADESNLPEPETAAPAEPIAEEPAPEQVQAQPAQEAPATEAAAAPQVHEAQQHEAHHHEQGGHGVMHVEVHPHVRWHADVLVDGHDIYHGFVKEVTDEGADLFLDYNLQYTRSVKLHILVPPLSAPSRPHVLAVSAKILSTVYDSDEECFRSAVHFTQFSPLSEQAFLHNRLE